MRKPIIIAGAVVAGIALAGGGYWSYWTSQAASIQQSVVLATGKMNSYGRTLDPSVTMVRYQALEVSGFPLEYRLVIRKPELAFPVTAIVRHFQPNIKMPYAKNETQWNQIVDTDEVTIVQSIGADAATVRFPSPLIYQTSLNRHTQNVQEITSNDMSCRIKDAKHLVDQFATNSHTADAEPMRGLGLDAHFDCGASTIRALDQHSRAVLYTIDKALLALSDAPSGGLNRNLRFQTSYTNERFYPAGDAAYSNIFKAAFQLFQPLKANISSAIPPSKFGSSNQHIDVSYDGPVTKAGIENGDLHAKFDVNTFDNKNALFDSSASLHAKTDAGSPDSDDALKGNYRLTVSKQYDSVASAAITDPIARALLPHLSPLGTIKFDIDATGSIVSGFENHFSTAAITFDNFALATDPYGLSIKGDLSHTDQQNSANFTVKCTNCDRFVNDAGNYLIRIQKFYLQPRGPVAQMRLNSNFGLTKEQIAMAQRLMRKAAGVSEAGGAPTMVFRIEKNADEPLRINSKNLLQIFTQ